ncbi:MAG: hypothetical protein ABIY70_24070 [Capsulimonas sp.]|uniref:hypothetical protein n=1 Tax=Capsulimonas sp. TaxID=2494211 RepID=UPI0032652FB6
MLNLDHPMAKHIFAAAQMEDFLLVSAQRMTLVPSTERLAILVDCHQALDEMRRLNHEQFSASQFISDAIADAQESLEQIANLGGGNITENKVDGEGDCASCGSAITKFETYPQSDRYVIVCHQCVRPFMQAKSKLQSSQGFRTCFI